MGGGDLAEAAASAASMQFTAVGVYHYRAQVTCTVTIFITDHHGSTFRDETWSIPGKVRHDPS